MRTWSGFPSFFDLKMWKGNNVSCVKNITFWVGLFLSSCLGGHSAHWVPQQWWQSGVLCHLAMEGLQKPEHCHHTVTLLLITEAADRIWTAEPDTSQACTHLHRALSLQCQHFSPCLTQKWAVLPSKWHFCAPRAPCWPGPWWGGNAGLRSSCCLMALKICSQITAYSWLSWGPVERRDPIPVYIQPGI